jgi:hypothetical protein
MPERIPTAHPATAIVKDPLAEESRRNRRALLAISSVCLAARVLWIFPTQISAFGITFSTNSQKRNLIWTAIVFQGYFFIAFVISAISDFLQWRHEMGKEVEKYEQSDEAAKLQTADTDRMASEAHEEWRTRFFFLKLEAPLYQVSYELQKYMNKKIGLYGMLWNTYRYALFHHLLLFWAPVVLFLISAGFLVGWKP